MKLVKSAKILLAALLLSGATAGGLRAQDDNRVPEMVMALNEVLPLDFGAFSFHSVSYNSGSLVFTMVFPDVMMEQMSSANADTTANNMLATYASNPELAAVLEALVENDVELVVLIRGKTTKKTFEVSLTPNQMRKALKNPPAVQYATVTDVDKELERTNAMLPLSLGNGITIKSIAHEGNAVVMTMVFDEGTVSYEAICTKAEGMLQTMMQQPASAASLQMCRDHKLDFTLRFEFTPSAKSCTATLPYTKM